MPRVPALAVLGLLAACFEPVGSPADGGGTLRRDAGGATTLDAGVLPPGLDAQVVKTCPAGCDDGDPCTADVCDPLTGCVHPKEPDGTPCPGSRTCRAGACCAPSEACASNTDDDCDGLTDCADPECQPRGNEIGKVCDAIGHTCSPRGQEGSTCSVCFGNGGTVEASEALCGDGHDNDCDGKVDCQDPKCAGQICDRARSKICEGTTLQCECPNDASSETICDDLMDDDCDGLVDCLDTDCLIGVACVDPTRPSMSMGTKCAVVGGNRACLCSGNGGKPETGREGTCGDGFDNDCDGLIDCQDGDCLGDECSPATGKICSASLLCTCPRDSVVETTCDDLVDDDCDGHVDCEDSDCPLGAECRRDHLPSAGMRCSYGSCVCAGNGGVPEGAKEMTCSDGFDNDCDGLADCSDQDCSLKGCALGWKLCDPATQSCRCPAGQVEQAGMCICSGGAPEVCADGADNDCDGKLDCADPDCDGEACTEFGKVCELATHLCACAFTFEQACADAADEDCDGMTDCADSDCAASPSCP